MSHYDQRVTTYFGDNVLQAGFLVTPHLLLRHYRALDLQAEHLVFLQLLMEITWDFAAPPNTMRKLADRMGVSLRTVQRYSEYVAERGLVEIYEQFEEGAQVENCYDLAPLFARLASFAPDASPSGTPRTRRRRGDAVTVPPAAATPRVTAVIAPHDSGDTGGSVTAVIPAPVAAVMPPPVIPISPALSPLTGLNTDSKIPIKKQKKAEQVALPAAAWSLRWDVALLPAEVEQSAAALATAGVTEPLRGKLAHTLHPAEAWGLVLHGAVKGWPVRVLIGHIYHKPTQQPQPAAELTAEHDAAGQLLAALPAAAALAIIQAVAERRELAPPLVQQPAALAAFDTARSRRRPAAAANRGRAAGAAGWQFRA